MYIICTNRYYAQKTLGEFCIVKFAKRYFDILGDIEEPPPCPKL
jgi:hypothetical protein